MTDLGSLDDPVSSLQQYKGMKPNVPKVYHSCIGSFHHCLHMSTKRYKNNGSSPSQLQYIQGKICGSYKNAEGTRNMRVYRFADHHSPHETPPMLTNDESHASVRFSLLKSFSWGTFVVELKSIKSPGCGRLGAVV